MKRFLTFLLLICFVFPVAQADEKIYLALGDSITTGYGLADSEKGFAKLIAEKNGYKLVNRAVNGATTADVLALLEQQSVLNTVAKADLITLTCGGNDLMGLLFMQSAAVYNTMAAEQISTGDAYAILTNPSDPRQGALMYAMQNMLMGTETSPGLVDSPVMTAALIVYGNQLNDVIAKIRAVNPDAAIIVSTQYNPFQFFTGDYVPFGQIVGRAVEKLSGVITANAEAAGYLVADAYSAFAAGTENLCCASMQPFNPDPHPNAAGHQVLAECFQQVINNMQ